jgi:Mn2+/Fe2+ NRAMP family transporter
MTSNRELMGDKANSGWLRTLGWITVATIFAASIGLAVTWFI